MSAQSNLADLIAVSRYYGNDSQYVLLGGGNTSVKDAEVLIVKASGHALGSITEEGFVRMNLPQLNSIWSKEYPADDKTREDMVLQDMMDCRCSGETARPSVEALLHALIPFTFVVHLHPSMVNGLTCGQSGAEAVRILFPDALWIPLVKPGYTLAEVVRQAMADYAKERSGAVPQVIMLQNHGVFVGADTVDGIHEIYDGMMKTLSSHMVRRPNFSEVAVHTEDVRKVGDALHRFWGEDADVRMAMNVELETKLQDKEAFYPISSALTPDHIVYSGFKPLWIGDDVFASSNPVNEIVRRCEAFTDTEGVAPKVVCVQNRGAFAFGEKALLLFLDTVKVSVFAESFGGVRFMDDEMIDFIRNWEVERYRSSVLK